MTLSLRPFACLVLVLFTAAVTRATIGIGLQMQLGNPSGATADPSNTPNFLLDRAQMALAYNNDTRDPNWVSWDLTTADVGTLDRSNFIPDPDLPPGYFAVTTLDYNGVGNVRIDRGHMSPSKDRTVTQADNQVVFYMTNIVPQAADNNQGPWALFEDECRTIAALGNELLIISGPSGFSSATIPSGVAFVPSFVWKIVVVVPNTGEGSARSRITSATRVIALKLPNVNGIRSVPWTDYITSAAEIEADTGYRFFTDLLASVADALRIKVDPGATTPPGTPVILTQPAPQTAVLGGNASFSVAASGGALTYQWRQDGDDIAGATAPTFALANIQSTDAGAYDVLVSNPAGSTLSNPATLTVSAPAAPTITVQPTPLTVAAGSTATFSAAASGVPTPTLQWYKGMTALAGATGASLVLNNVQSSDGGLYRLTATNSAGTAPSEGALLTVTPVAPTITTPPASQSVPVGDSPTLTVIASGSIPFSYQWRKNGSAIPGATNASLTLANVQNSDGGSYDVVVTNPARSVASALAVISITPAGAGAPSTIFWDFTTASPTSGVPAGVTGGTVTQGNNNGITPLLTTTSASPTTGSNIFSGFNNAGAAARTGTLNTAAGGSAYFELTLAPPAGKQLVATALSFGSRSTGTGPAAFTVYSSSNNFATSTQVASGTLTVPGNAWLLYAPPMSAVTGAVDTPITFRIYGYSGSGSPGANTANWRIDDLKLTVNMTTGAASAPTVAVSATSPAANAINAAITAPITISFNVPVTVTGSWFTIISAASGAVTASVSGGPTNFTLTPTTSFALSDTITTSIASGLVTDQATGTGTLTSNYGFSFTTVAPTPPGITTQPRPQIVVVGSTATFNVAATGTAPLSYRWRKGAVSLDDVAGHIAGVTTAALTITNVAPVDADSYDVVIDNPANAPVASSAVALTVSSTPVAPSIVTPPAPQTVSAGSAAVFSVLASGTAPLSYQWRWAGSPLSNGAGVSGATSDTLTLAGVSPGQAGSYDVVVSNGTPPDATSASAVLTVNTASGLSLFSYAGGYHMQNFDTLPAAGSFTFGTSGPIGFDAPVASGGVGAAAMTGWSFARYAGTGSTALFRVDTGSGTSGSAVSYGSNGSSDRALGALASGSNISRFGVALVNHTGAPITQFTLRYAGEQWRHGGATSPNKLTFAYALGGADINTGTFIAVPALDFTSPVVTTASGALIGNLDPNRAIVMAQVSGLTWNVGQVLVLRWSDVDDGSADDGLAIDDLVFTTESLAPPAIVTQPISQSVDAGAPVTFSITATGTPAPTYQWRKNGVAIAGATDSSLSLGAAFAADQGSYTCTVTNVAANVVSDPATLTVAQAVASVTLDNLTATYDSAPHAATATTSPAGLPVSLSYNGSTSAPTAAGSYVVVGTIQDSNYQGSATATLTIGQATAAVSLTNLSQTYDGAPKSIGVTTAPAGLAADVSYDGSSTAPTNAGSYSVVVTVNDANYTGSATATLAVQKQPATVTLASLNQLYDGSPKMATALTSPPGLQILITYNGGSSPPTSAGSYAVIASIQDPNRFGSASGTLVIASVSATIELGPLALPYDGTPRVVTATTSPVNLSVTVTYDGGPIAPTYPGSYAVVATLTEPNYAGSVSGTLVVSTTALVRHAPNLNGDINGSIQVLQPETFSLNSGALVASDLLVPGTPTIRINGNPNFGGTREGPGSVSPSTYQITLNGGAVLRHLIRRIDAIALPAVSAPPPPAGTRNVAVNSGQPSNIGDFATLRNLTLNGNAGQITVPAGTYGNFSANANSGFTLGVAGATVPSIYNLQNLTLNSGARLRLVGPVVLKLANGTAFNSATVDSAVPAWLNLNVANGGVTLNGSVIFHGFVVAPNGTVTINGSSTLVGGVIADRLTINSGAELRAVQP